MTSYADRRVLIVDDEPNALNASSSALKLNGVTNVRTEADSRLVLGLMEQEAYDAVILDLFMPHLSGMDILPLITERYPQVPVIVVTAAYELERAVESMRLGAYDYLVKPVENERLVTALFNAFERSSLTEQLVALRDRLIQNRLECPEAFHGIVTQDRKMQAIFQYVEVIARSPQPVLITGESGTGKELIAQALHRLSGCSGQLVAVNLAGLDDAMFSDTLFGHRKGAFTSADQARDGLVVRALGGVLFLDEIGDLSEASQIKLLRLLQEREFYPVGSDQPRSCNAHIVCASNKDIKALAAEGRFRNDLFFRLCTHQIDLPPLRERKGDIPLLLDFFVKQASPKVGIQTPSIPRELGDLLGGYDFPGNVRELEAMVFDAVIRSKTGHLSLDPFKQRIGGARKTRGENLPVPEGGGDALQRRFEEIWGHFPTLHEAELTLIDTAMKISKNNQGIAASMLGLKRQTFNLRLKNIKQRG